MTPKDFLKQRRPEQFSDSLIPADQSIGRSQLDYYIETLGSRKQEGDFESFAKKLCEKEICPNLTSQTGSTGGGDRKVDSETHPVSIETALKWFVGVNTGAHEERWGFAISTMKDWKSKLISDIKSAVSTGRDYKAIFFITSQYVRDKTGSEVEDSLSKEYSVDVRILDRTWILDKVFSGGHEQLAMSELSIDLPEDSLVKKGFNDLQKEEEIEGLEKVLEKTISEGNHLGAYDAALKSAILSRELERSEVEILGKFERVIKISSNLDDYKQFEALYQKTWTQFWWLDDFDAPQDNYNILAELAYQSSSIFVYERLMSIRALIVSVTHCDKLKPDFDFVGATKRLVEKLNEIANSDSARSASLQAQMMLEMIALTTDRDNHDAINQALVNLKRIVSESKGLIGFPFKQLVQLLTGSGDFFETFPAYEYLFEEVMEVSKERDGELTAAMLQFERANQQLRARKPYRAIKNYSLAITKLYKEESKDAVVKALFNCSLAYEEVSLLWAARGTMVAAASLAASDLWKYDEVNLMQVACYSRLKTVELLLGRIPQSLEWHSLDVAVRNILIKKGHDPEDIFSKIDQYDFIFGNKILRLKFDFVHELKKLPDMFDNLGLFLSREATIYTLGRNDYSEEFTEAVTSSELDDFFLKWASQKPDNIRAVAELIPFGNTVLFESYILGCSVEIEYENVQPCIEVAESLIAGTECFLSTLVPQGASARQSKLKISVKKTDCKEYIKHSVDNSGVVPVINVECSDFKPHDATMDQQAKIRECVFHISSNIMVLPDEDSINIMVLPDEGSILDNLMRIERAQDRLNFSGSFIYLGNVLGPTPAHKLEDILDEGIAEYEVKRTEPIKIPEVKEPKVESDSPDREMHSHADLGVASVIDSNLWDNAGWQGVGIATSEDLPPVFSIAFSNDSVGKEIFSKWREQFGEVDKQDEIRVVIIKGIDKSNPYHYRVVIRSNCKEELKSGRLVMVVSSRFHTMTPSSHENLDRFLGSYREYNQYLLAPGRFDENLQPIFHFNEGIVKREVIVRDAWEIGPNDLDCMGILLDDDPIIPPGIKEVPVKELIKQRKEKYGE